MYTLLRNLLFRLPPEASHDLTLQLLALAGRSGMAGFYTVARARLDGPAGPGPVPGASTPVQLLGLEFPNRVGLAAGLDKNADAIDGLAACGFGFLEVGTVTPRPQPGNPQPRMFRLPEHQALINRMGFNNLGLEHLVRRVQAARFSGVLGVNIGKNRDTPADQAVADYLLGLDAVAAVASYVTLNLSSPNTPGLRDLQYGAALGELLRPLAQRRDQLADSLGRKVPLLVKVAPDVHDDDLPGMADTLMDCGMDGIIAGNTTVARGLVQGHVHASEAGGLSGEPLRERALAVVTLLREHLGPAVPLIGVGGISTAAHAAAMVAAGADLVQLYTGFVYTGPGLVSAAVRSTSSR